VARRKKTALGAFLAKKGRRPRRKPAKKYNGVLMNILGIR